MNSNPASIHANKNFQNLLKELSKRIFEKRNQFIFSSPEEVQQWMEKQIGAILFPVDISTLNLQYSEPKLQISKSGKLGDGSYAAPKDRQHYRRRLPSKPYRLTPARKNQQERVKQARNYWKSLDISIKTQWEQTKLSDILYGVYLFNGVCICLLKNNRPIPDPFLPTPELIDYYQQQKKT